MPRLLQASVVKGPGEGVRVTGQQVLGGCSLGFPSMFWFLYPLLLFESNHFPVDSGYIFLFRCCCYCWF